MLKETNNLWMFFIIIFREDKYLISGVYAKGCGIGIKLKISQIVDKQFCNIIGNCSAGFRKIEALS